MPALTLPIVLSAKRISWRLADGHSGEADLAFGAIRADVLSRDEHTCQGCGFRADKWQEVHHKDDDHHNNKPSNLATVCCFCHQCFHLGMVGLQRSGLMIWLPEISQTELHNICRGIFVAVKNAKKNEEAALKLYSAFESRAQVIEEEFGPGASNPATWGQAMLEMTPEQYAARAERFGSLRLLPYPSAFHRQVTYWATDPKLYGRITDEDWERIADFNELKLVEVDETESVSEPSHGLDTATEIGSETEEREGQS